MVHMANHHSCLPVVLNIHLKQINNHNHNNKKVEKNTQTAGEWIKTREKHEKIDIILDIIAKHRKRTNSLQVTKLFFLATDCKKWYSFTANCSIDVRHLETCSTGFIWSYLSNTISLLMLNRIHCTKFENTPEILVFVGMMNRWWIREKAEKSIQNSCHHQATRLLGLKTEPQGWFCWSEYTALMVSSSNEDNGVIKLTSH